MDDFRITPASAEQLAAVVATFGQGQYFANRFERQHAGSGILLIAWDGLEPVADLYIRLEPAEERELRQRLPGVVVLDHVEVRADRRGQHIGSALILAAEQLLIERRRDLVALGVAPNNYQAYRLYRRLRYQPWGYPDVETFSETFLEDGTRVRAKETCRVLVKRLPVADIGAESD